MADNTLTTTKKLLKPIVGDSNNEWGGFLNTTMDQIDSAFGGTIRRTLAGDIQLTANDILNSGFYFSGTLTTTTRVTFPTYYGSAFIRNATTQRLTVGMVSGATVTVLSGQTAGIWSDGQDFVITSIGYAPVQQGGGASQGNNKVYLGWNSTTSRLRAQVDTTDIGDLAMQNDMAAVISASALPRGIITLWFGTAATVPLGWHLCDGSAGTPDLRDRFVVGAGISYNTDDKGGSNSVSVTSGAAGAHSHGAATGAASPGTNAAASHSHGGATTGHTLTKAEMPSHDHGTGGAQFISYPSGFTGNRIGLNVADVNLVHVSAEGGDGSHSHGINADGGHSHLVDSHTHSITGALDHSHTVSFDNRPTYYALAYIMKT